MKKLEQFKSTQSCVKWITLFAAEVQTVPTRFKSAISESFEFNGKLFALFRWNFQNEINKDKLIPDE